METLDTIKSLLEKNNLTQKSLTDYLGINKNAFTNWLNGNNTSYIKHLPQIAEFFNVSTDYLLGREQKQDDIILSNKAKNPEIQQIIHKLATFEVPDNVIEFINNALDAYRK